MENLKEEKSTEKVSNENESNSLSNDKQSKAENNAESNKVETNNKTTTQEEDKKEQSFISKFKYYVLAFVVFQVILSIINGLKEDPVNSFSNILPNNTYYDLNFYLTETISTYTLRKENLFYTMKDLKYCYKKDKDLPSQNIYYRNASISYNISQILKMKNKKRAALYIVSEIKLHDNKLYSYLARNYQLPKDAYYNFLNIFKYVDDLSSFFSSDSSDEVQTESELKKQSMLSTVNDKNYIPHLYYRNTISFFIPKVGQKQDASFLLALKQLRQRIYVSEQTKEFFPIFGLNDFWTSSSELIPVNNTEIFTFNFSLSHSYIFYYFYTTMIGVNYQSEISILNAKAKDVLIELLKYNSIPYLVILFTVQILHMIFSSLDFMSNISYYKNLKKLDGVYTKYIFFNLFHLLVATIYVLVKGADFISKIMLVKDLVFQLWKLRKVFSIKVDKVFPFIHFNYKIDFLVEKSKDYENEAVALMTKFFLIPVGIIYLIYRIYYFYGSKTSLFDFVIEYIFFLFSVFGFILMTPQIYLNYKLKSVDHFPLKVMIYKFLDTIVDDLEIFALKTPTMYRIFCFKDDVIFVIYLYQLFKYKDNRILEMAKKEEEKVKNNMIDMEEKNKEEKPKKE